MFIKLLLNSRELTYINKNTELHIFFASTQIYKSQDSHTTYLYTQGHLQPRQGNLQPGIHTLLNPHINFNLFYIKIKYVCVHCI